MGPRILYVRNRSMLHPSPTCCTNSGCCAGPITTMFCSAPIINTESSVYNMAMRWNHCRAWSPPPQPLPPSSPPLCPTTAGTSSTVVDIAINAHALAQSLNIKPCDGWCGTPHCEESDWVAFGKVCIYCEANAIWHESQPGCSRVGCDTFVGMTTSAGAV